jgi:hypothetical protein
MGGGKVAVGDMSDVLLQLLQTISIMQYRITEILLKGSLIFG